MKEGNFPNYTEPKISFMPTFKVLRNEKSYISKEKRAFTDRILFKNNSNFEVEEDLYNGLHEVFGSDHRPVVRALTIKDFKQPTFAEINKLLDIQNPVQGYG